MTIYAFDDTVQSNLVNHVGGKMYELDNEIPIWFPANEYVVLTNNRGLLNTWIVDTFRSSHSIFSQSFTIFVVAL